MTRRIRRITAFIFVSLLFSTLISCGGSGGGDSAIDSAIDTDTSAKGTVGILLTDKPADSSLFSSINATIVKVELMDTGDEGDDRIALYSGAPRTVDLLRLKNEAIPFTFNDDIPVGNYCKIRLTLSDLELVFADDTPNDSTDNETSHPHLPGNGKLDLVARDCFDVDEGRVTTLQLDIDAGKSIHVTGNGTKYNFRPVIFVDVISQEFESKLVRLDGVITRVDPDNNRLLLCNAVTAHKSNSNGCVNVHLGENSAFFDNLEYTGSPRSIEELLSETKINENATVIGWARHLVIYERDDDDDDYDHHAWMEIEALVVELGDFLQVEGEVAINADSDGFGMTVTSSGAVITDDTLAVVLQPGSPGINGTRIISKSGELLDYTSITVPSPVQVDGVLELLAGNEAMLKSALVIVDFADPGIPREQVTGLVLAIGDDSLVLLPDDNMVCGVFSNQLSVTFGDDVETLTIIITNTSSAIIPGGTVEPGQAIGMNGICDGVDFVADSTVIVDDRR
jgi:hypothetical protein